MNLRNIATAMAVAAACSMAGPGPASAQTPGTTQPPTQDASNAAPAPSPAADAPAQAPATTPLDPAPAKATQPADALSPSPVAAPSAPAGPLIAYVKRTKPPFLLDQTIAAAELGMIGAIAAISAGHDIVAKNSIEDPSGDVAHRIAVAYAATQSGQVAEAPISDDQMPPKTKPDEIGKYAGTARYVVVVAPVNMEIIYFVTDPLRRDLMLSSSGEIIDTSNGKVIAKGRCFIKSEKVGQRYNHDTLLADQAAGLKSLIVQKSEQCANKMEEQMKIGPAGATPAA